KVTKNGTMQKTCRVSKVTPSRQTRRKFAIEDCITDLELAVHKDPVVIRSPSAAGVGSFSMPEKPSAQGRAGNKAAPLEIEMKDGEGVGESPVKQTVTKTLPFQKAAV